MVATTKELIDESVSFNRGAQFADKIFDSARKDYKQILMFNVSFMASANP